MTLEGDTLFNNNNGVVTYFPPFDNIYQQKRAGRHTNHSKNKITTYSSLSSYHIPILNLLHQKKTMNHLKSNHIHPVKDETIPSSKVTKSYVKLITYMNKNNVFDLLIAVVFSISQKIGVIGTKYQYLVISFAFVKDKIFCNSTSDIFR